jgi:hypothetical protein
VLRVVLFEADGELGLFELAIESGGLSFRLCGLELLLVAYRGDGTLDGQLLDELLLDTRGALQVVAGEVVDRGAGDTREVDAAMVLETNIFRSDQGVFRER